jgi:hypothetical protein
MEETRMMKMYAIKQLTVHELSISDVRRISGYPNRYFGKRYPDMKKYPDIRIYPDIFTIHVRREDY